MEPNSYYVCNLDYEYFHTLSSPSASELTQNYLTERLNDMYNSTPIY